MIYLDEIHESVWDLVPGAGVILDKLRVLCYAGLGRHKNGHLQAFTSILEYKNGHLQVFHSLSYFSTSFPQIVIIHTHMFLQIFTQNDSEIHPIFNISLSIIF